MYEYEDREPREGDLVVWEDVSDNNPHIEQNKPYYVIEAENALVTIYNKNNDISELGDYERKVIKQIKPEEAKKGDMIFRRNGSSIYFKKFSSRQILYIDKINNKYIFGYSVFDYLTEDQVIIYREQKQVQKEDIYQDTDYIKRLLENGVKLHSEPTLSGSGIVTIKEDFLNPDITYALANRLDGEPLPINSFYKIYWQQKFQQGENVYFYGAIDAGELKCGEVPEDEEDASPSKYEPKNMGYVFFFIKKEIEAPKQNEEYRAFWKQIKETDEKILINSKLNELMFPTLDRTIPKNGWTKDYECKVNQNLYYALESQQDIPLPGTQQYFDYWQQKHNNGVKISQFYPGTKEWSTSYLKENFSTKTWKDWNRESICLFREWNRERDLNPSQYTQDTTYANHPKNTIKGWYVYLNKDPNGYYLWQNGTVNKMAYNPKTDKYPGYFEHEDEAWRAREEYIKKQQSDSSLEPEIDINIYWEELSLNLISTIENNRCYPFERKDGTVLSDTGYEECKELVQEFIEEHQSLALNGIPEYVYNAETLYIEDYVAILCDIEDEIHKLSSKQNNSKYDDSLDAIRHIIEPKTDIKGEVANYPTKIWSQLNNLNKNKEETMTNNVTIKEEIKEAIAEMICNKEEKAVKAKTDYQRRPKVIAIYYTSTGSEIESKSFKTEQDAKDHLVVLQSQGNPNAKVTIYKREKTHKIKNQFETIS